MVKSELLAPAGNFECLESALYFGADAVYFASKDFSLRAGADNFNAQELYRAIELCHTCGRKAYIACNIFAHNRDLSALKDYLQYLNTIRPDGIIASDPGVISLIKKFAPKIPIHLSTQANTTNAESAKFWVSQGVERIVLARELTVEEISQIRNALSQNIELEAFIHGAMCVSYSGRCLLSNFLTNRSGNRGECAQSCRWEYEIREASRGGEYLSLTEDGRGSYILNSRDMNCIRHLRELQKAGVTSFKIEGRNKTAYYVGNVVNAYRRAINFYAENPQIDLPREIEGEVYKSAHRNYFSGFYFGQASDSQNYESAAPVQSRRFVGLVTGCRDGFVEIEQRNRIVCGDILEVLSPSHNHNQTISVSEIFCENGEKIAVANVVKQKLKIKTSLTLKKGDMLRIEI